MPHTNPCIPNKMTYWVLLILTMYGHMGVCLYLTGKNGVLRIPQSHHHCLPKIHLPGSSPFWNKGGGNVRI